MSATGTGDRTHVWRRFDGAVLYGLTSDSWRAGSCKERPPHRHRPFEGALPDAEQGWASQIQANAFTRVVMVPPADTKRPVRNCSCDVIDRDTTQSPSSGFNGPGASDAEPAEYNLLYVNHLAAHWTPRSSAGATRAAGAQQQRMRTTPSGVAGGPNASGGAGAPFSTAIQRRMASSTTRSKPRMKIDIKAVSR